MLIIGADEVGRGSLAGPVTVGAVMTPEELSGMDVTDSKKLSQGRRQAIDKVLRAHPNVKFALASRPATDVDRLGIAECLKQCFVEVVQKMMVAAHGQKVRIRIDGEAIKGFPFQAEYIIKGDDKVWHIGAASIIAKVWRDAYMTEESKNHLGYGWEHNSGYGTSGHTDAIRAHGLSPLHRATFCRSFTKPIVVAESEPASNIISDLFG